MSDFIIKNNLSRDEASHFNVLFIFNASLENLLSMHAIAAFDLLHIEAS